MRRRRQPQLPTPSLPGSVVVDVRGISVDLAGRRVLSAVELDVRAGEVLALVGPNGAGKSTLLAGICGDVPTTAGSVVVDGRPLGAWTPVELAMRRAALPQQTTVSFPFTVAEVVAMGRAPWAGTPLDELDEQVVIETMRATEVVEFAARPFTSLSGGEQARAALARVLAQRTQVLLLDEPTAALDLHHQELVLEIARSRTQVGDAVVVVLHDLGLAAAHADRVAVLAEGLLVADGPAAEVLTPELLSDVYRHPVEVLHHPRTGLPLILVQRPAPDPSTR